MPSDSSDIEELFACRQCGDCCKGYGGTHVTAEDIEAISDYIGSDPRRFVDQYCCLSGTKPVLAQRSDGFCIFWDGLCTIHPVKPHMCKRWPFIESILVDSDNWLTMADSCPGIQPGAPVDVVKKLVKKLLMNDE